MNSRIHKFQILPVNIKCLAGSIATLLNWLTSWVVTMTANCYEQKIKRKEETGTFTIYTMTSALIIAFVALWVPETRGRSLEEIQNSFR
ncbi:hypothetical protein EZV62_014219 [Acer yangbiense]|uniref:Major facilitator superfamily (MFS) profile domain-containing protein n=1 Tax=Acer yangbiense TaxID=1000413 RepID=A0A5C7HTL4_9ROSI|nr:hypothetical protein EZV62_014219 [Acer yangbiense]